MGLAKTCFANCNCPNFKFKSAQCKKPIEKMFRLSKEDLKVSVSYTK